MIDGAIDDFDLSGAKIALIVGHVIVRVPHAKLEVRKELDALARRSCVVDRDAMHLGGVARRNEIGLLHPDAVPLAGNRRVSESVPRHSKKSSSRFTGMYVRRPTVAAVVDVEAAASSHVRGRVPVVAISREPAQASVTIEAIASGLMGNDAEKILAPEIVDPGIGVLRRGDHVFATSIIELAELHGMPPTRPGKAPRVHRTRQARRQLAIGGTRALDVEGGAREARPLRAECVSRGEWIDMVTRVSFPPGFVWGAATSSYQIEGATNEDGRGESIWDRDAKTVANIEDGSSGDIACDHYHRWREDIALMSSLKLAAYRFSVAWPRVHPTGRSPVNDRGLDFYSRLVDALLERGIAPYVTLYHWDLPQALQDVGGWVNRDTAHAFVEYAEAVSRRLGDRVKHWITHNEPWCASFVSYAKGVHAPGLRDWSAAIASSHHLLLSHGWAVPVIRRNSPGSEVGITVNLSPAVPASPSPDDADAARHYDGFMNRWFSTRCIEASTRRIWCSITYGLDTWPRRECPSCGPAISGTSRSRPISSA